MSSYSSVALHLRIGPPVLPPNARSRPTSESWCRLRSVCSCVPLRLSEVTAVTYVYVLRLLGKEGDADSKKNGTRGVGRGGS